MPKVKGESFLFESFGIFLTIFVVVVVVINELTSSLKCVPRMSGFQIMAMCSRAPTLPELLPVGIL